MYHPFQSIPVDARTRWFIILVVITFALMAILNVIGSPLITSAAPSGVDQVFGSYIFATL